MNCGLERTQGIEIVSHGVRLTVRPTDRPPDRPYRRSVTDRPYRPAVPIVRTDRPPVRPCRPTNQPVRVGWGRGTVPYQQSYTNIPGTLWRGEGKGGTVQDLQAPGRGPGGRGAGCGEGCGGGGGRGGGYLGVLWPYLSLRVARNTLSETSNVVSDRALPCRRSEKLEHILSGAGEVKSKRDVLEGKAHSTATAQPHRINRNK